MSRALALGFALALGAAGGWSAEIADPTRPAAGHRDGWSQIAAANAGIELSSILISPHRRVAVINGKLVAPGDRIAGAVVTEIDGSSVVLAGTRGEFRVYLISPLKKLPHPAAGADPEWEEESR